MATNDLDRYRGCLLGLAAGDAVGTTVEFQPRGSFRPVTNMVGGGEFQLIAGQWTDDTSMALCLATSLVEKKGFDPLDQMQRYLRWYEDGYLSSTGRCFDIGLTTRQSLEHFHSTGVPFSGSHDALSAGNAPIMRLAPVPMYYAPDLALAVEYAGESSRTTHGAVECVEACQLFAEILVKALGGGEKNAILSDNNLAGFTSEKISAIARGAYQSKNVDQIRSDGYVVHTLEAALWCFWRTGSFSEAILAAANLGCDADTTAAVCGQVAGAYYGQSGIPAHWQENLHMRAEINALADKLLER